MISFKLSNVVFVATLIGSVGAHFRWVYYPMVRETRALREQLRGTQLDYEAGIQFSAGLEEVQEYLDEFRQAIVDLDQLVPPKFDADHRIREVSIVIKACGLRDDSIRPDPSLPRGDVTAHPLTVRVAGPYASVLKFLNLAESLPQFTRVTRLTVTRDVGEARIVVAEVELTSYSVGGGV